MRGKRAKQYRKLMHQYALTFNFREPYQVLLDSQIIQDAARFKMDLVGSLERTLQGKVKPMITQCDMRRLYTAQPKDETLILQAKQYERRRCDHHELDEPLSTVDCLSQVVDPKDALTNKHRYAVASQDVITRGKMRTIPGVPLIYIHRSVMILEPISTSTENLRGKEEKDKLKSGLKGRRDTGHGPKRKRVDEDEDKDEDKMVAPKITAAEATAAQYTDARPRKKNRRKGPKGPNPLSVKRPKKQPRSQPPETP